MEKEKVIELIAGRIMDERRKHPLLEWDKIAAAKIYSQWIEYFKETNKWISVKDELPPINVPVLCYQKNKHAQFRKLVLGFDGKAFKDFYNGSDDYILFMDGNYPFITHWMSLPNRPMLTPEA